MSTSYAYRRYHFYSVWLLLSTYLLRQSTPVYSVKSIPPVERPQLVKDAIQKNRPIYYFGLGSNMSRKKLENRGINGTKISIMQIEPAIVRNHRLAFNMRGFPPIEPGMGSLEPIESISRPILAYKHGECHGALVKLTPENYEKVMRSEGVGNEQQQQQGYEEIVIDAYPYRRPNKPVKAIALRARDHIRLQYDPCPSPRYMSILREGAKELGLRPCYQEFLERHPVQSLAVWQRKQAIYNLICMFSISTILKWRGLTRLQTWLLFLVYVPPSPKPQPLSSALTSYSIGFLKKTISDILSALILLPGAIFGFIYFQIMKTLGRIPPSITRLLSLLDQDYSNSTTRRS